MGTIQGGLSVNTMPDRCTIEIDRRMIPGEKWSSVFKQITDFVASRIDFPIVHDDPYMKGSTLGEGANSSVAQRMSEAARRRRRSLRASRRSLRDGCLNDRRLRRAVDCLRPRLHRSGPHVR